MKNQPFLLKLLPYVFLFLGLLFYAFGILRGSMMIELFGCFVLFIGIAIIAARKWEKEESNN